MHRFSVIGFSLVSLFVILLPGCQKTPDWVARVEAVGDQAEWTLSADEFRDIAARRWINIQNAAKQSEQDLHEYAESLALNRLKIIDGYNKGLGTKPEARDAYRDVMNQVAVKAMFNGEILDKMVTEEEIREFYEHDREEIEVSHIMLRASPDPNDFEPKRRLDRIRQQIMDGADFHEMAAAHNEDESTANAVSSDPNGYIGWTPWGRMVEPFQSVAFGLKPGEVSKPVKTMYGWHLIKVHGRRQRDIEPLEDARERIIQNIAYRKQDTLSQAADAFLNSAMEERNFQLHEDNIHTIYVALEGKKRESDPAGRLTVEQQQLPLASVDNGEVKLVIRDVLERAESMGPVSRVLKDEESLSRMAQQILQNEYVLPDKAKELGYFEDEEAVEAAEQERDRKVQQLVQQVMVYDRSKPTEEQAKQYFEEYKKDYYTDPRFTLIEILVSDETLANQLAERIRDGENMRELAAAYTERKTAGDKQPGIVGPLKPTQYGTLGKKAAEAEMGELVGPFPMRGKKQWSMFKIIAREEPAPQDFDAVRQDVHGDLSMQLRKDLMTAWEDSLRNTISYKIAGGLQKIFADVETEPTQQNE